MDWQRRLQEAQQYVDQTYGAYGAAQEQTKQAKQAYDIAFNQRPDYQTIYDQYKRQSEQDLDVSGTKTTLDKSKEALAVVKDQLDRLSTTIVQRFGGNLTEEELERVKEPQEEALTSRFKQYNADYQTKFNDYHSRVEKAFNQALGLTNKQSDSYWSGIKRRADDWNTAVKNEEQWSDMATQARYQQQSVQSAYDWWNIKQRWMAQEREIEANRTKRYQNAINSELSRARASSEREYNAMLATARKRSDIAKTQSGELSLAEYFRRYEGGAYAGAY
jgi:hypothetical protein